LHFAVVFLTAKILGVGNTEFSKWAGEHF